MLGAVGQRGAAWRALKPLFSSAEISSGPRFPTLRHAFKKKMAQKQPLPPLPGDFNNKKAAACGNHLEPAPKSATLTTHFELGGQQPHGPDASHCDSR
jgi:hypothetical protein